MISSIIDNKIKVDYQYPSKYGRMIGKEVIKSCNNNRTIEVKDYILTIDRFIELNISINYDYIRYSNTDD